ncbi:MAG: hypothetical protein GXX85_18450 [Ignavibacteria bacterium]|nr:hypothetical protein [Ignavibacteria bacterium]
MEQREFRQLAKDYFSFTRSERRGMAVLCAILAVALAVNFMPGRTGSREVAGREEFLQMMALMEESPGEYPAVSLKLFPFDPNRITAGELDSLDLPPAVKRNLLRYREKGGSFRRATDFGRLYGMKDSLMAVVSPYLVVTVPERPADKERNVFQRTESGPAGDKGEEGVVPKYETPYKSPGIVELNRTDSAGLLDLPGIGPAFAGRIIRYRNILGGFVSPDQLMEVYGMTRERMDQFLPFVTADTALVRPIRINFADIRTIAGHPYIDREEAARIVDFRSANGPFTSPAELLDHQLVNGEKFRKVGPYLSCR